MFFLYFQHWKAFLNYCKFGIAHDCNPERDNSTGGGGGSIPTLTGEPNQYQSCMRKPGKATKKQTKKWSDKIKTAIINNTTK